MLPFALEHPQNFLTDNLMIRVVKTVFLLKFQLLMLKFTLNSKIWSMYGTTNSGAANKP